MSTLTLSNKALSATGETVESLQRHGVFRQVFAMLLLSAAIAGGLWLFFWTQKPPMVSVQAGMDSRSAAEVADMLRTEQIPYEIDSVTGEVKVAADSVQVVRLKMAASGLSGSSSQGMAMIEKDPGFGVSQFVENARYQHALETELARTISQLRPVREARVHLAIPKPSAFTRQSAPAAASVVLRLQAGRTLNRREVEAISHLVASSIPNLTADRVTVVDESGSLLTRVGDDEGDLSAEQFERVRRTENSLVGKISELLEPVIGMGRVRSQISVDMDFSVTEEARETFRPESAQVRSEQLSQSSRSDGKAQPQGIPGATSNTPPGEELATEAVATGPTESSSNQTRNFEIDRTLSHVRQPSGRIRRITTAVVLDNISETDAEGVVSMRPLTPEELTRMESLVKEAVGFDANRGDSVAVVNAPFVRPEPLAEGEGPAIYENPQFMEWGRIGIGAAIVLALIFLVLRPALRTLLNPPRSYASGDPDAMEAQNLGTPQAVQGRATGNLALSNQGQQKMVPQTQYDAALEAARAAVAEDSKRVAQVVKDWVASDA